MLLDDGRHPVGQQPGPVGPDRAAGEHPGRRLPPCPPLPCPPLSLTRPALPCPRPLARCLQQHTEGLRGCRDTGIVNYFSDRVPVFVQNIETENTGLSYHPSYGEARARIYKSAKNSKRFSNFFDELKRSK